MILAMTLAAALALRPSAGPPQSMLAQVQRALPFRPIVLPTSAQLDAAEVVTEPDGVTGCRFTYNVEGVLIHVEERQPLTGGSSPPTDQSHQIFSLEGYPAEYSTAQHGYTRISTLTWYRQDLTVRVWAADGASPPLLVDVTLELR
jgi:hypothetical protein